jgi:serine/threonine protein kinase
MLVAPLRWRCFIRIAPEMLVNEKGHGRSVDVWAYGVLLYIMLTQEVCCTLALQTALKSLTQHLTDAMCLLR